MYTLYIHPSELSTHFCDSLHKIHINTACFGSCTFILSVFIRIYTLFSYLACSHRFWTYTNLFQSKYIESHTQACKL